MAARLELAFALRNTLIDALRVEVPDLVFFFPFRQSFSYQEVRQDGRIVLRLADDHSGGMPHIGRFEGQERLPAGGYGARYSTAMLPIWD